MIISVVFWEDFLSKSMFVILLLWFMWSLLFSLISYHDLLAILSRGYVCYRFIFLYVLFIVGVDVRPLTPGLGPSQLVSEPTGLLVHEIENRIRLG